MMNNLDFRTLDFLNSLRKGSKNFYYLIAFQFVEAFTNIKDLYIIRKLLGSMV